MATSPHSQGIPTRIVSRISVPGPVALSMCHSLHNGFDTFWSAVQGVLELAGHGDVESLMCRISDTLDVFRINAGASEPSQCGRSAAGCRVDPVLNGSAKVVER